VVPENEADGALGLDVGTGEDASQLHDERSAGAVVVRRLTPADAVHVATHDVHLVGMVAAHLGAIDLFALTGRARLCIKSPDFCIGLALGILVHADRATLPAEAATPLRRTARHSNPAAGPLP